MLPVNDGGELVGMITGRDLAVRAVALGLAPQTPVSEDMTAGARYCHPEDRLDKVLDGVGLFQVQRMPVLDQEGRLVGIVSFADTSSAMPSATADALREIWEPGGDHSQSNDGDPSGLVAPFDTLGDERGGNLLHFKDDEPS